MFAMMENRFSVLAMFTLARFSPMFLDISEDLLFHNGKLTCYLDTRKVMQYCKLYSSLISVMTSRGGLDFNISLEQRKCAHCHDVYTVVSSDDTLCETCKSGVKHTGCSHCQERFDVYPDNEEYDQFTDGVFFQCNACIDRATCGDCEKSIEDMIRCDGCETFFCFVCAEIDSVPEGDWYCSHCFAIFKKKQPSKRRPLDDITTLRQTLVRTVRQNVTSHQGIANIRAYLDTLEKEMIKEERKQQQQSNKRKRIRLSDLLN